MAKKNLDSLLHNILGDAEIRPQDKYEPPADEKAISESKPQQTTDEDSSDEPGSILPLSVPSNSLIRFRQ